MAHNKKRNTAFLFESLMREGTKAIIEKDTKKADFVKKVLIKYFNSSTNLKKELDLYNSLKENVEEEYAERYLQEVKARHDKIDKKALFNEQSSLIAVINKTLGQSFYNNFIPNYKDIATISQLFNDQTPIKEKVLLEASIIDDMKKNKTNESKELQPVDKIVYRTFTKKFNEKYSDLLSEQKNLLSKYVNSFSDSGLELKIFLNEEIDRLKEGLRSALKTQEIKSDKDMETKTLEVQKFLNDFKDAREITKDMLEKILKVQQFVHEVNN